jgi:hypothetical protein
MMEAEQHERKEYRWFSYSELKEFLKQCSMCEAEKVDAMWEAAEKRFDEMTGEFTAKVRTR